MGRFGREHPSAAPNAQAGEGGRFHGAPEGSRHEARESKGRPSHFRSAFGGAGSPTHSMTSEIPPAGLQPVLAELRQMRETMATKADLDASITNLHEIENNRRLERAEFELQFIQMCCSMLLKTALIIVLIVGLVNLLK